jgi:peptidoglycan/LPS O-acetylase OafA/YrhL
MRFFGKYSYGIYIFQGIIAYSLYDNQTENTVAGWVGSHLLAMFVQAAAGIGLSVLVAVVSYEWFERRFLQLKRWFGEDTAHAPAPARNEAS